MNFSKFKFLQYIYMFTKKNQLELSWLYSGWLIIDEWY